MEWDDFAHRALPPKIGNLHAALLRLQLFAPEIDGGPFAIRRTVGKSLNVQAIVFADGHDSIACELPYRSADSLEWPGPHCHRRPGDGTLFDMVCNLSPLGCDGAGAALASMGFEVAYLPPVHPIGNRFGKGTHNSPVAEPGGVASLTPVPRHNYGAGVPQGGYRMQVLDSRAPLYGGRGQGNVGGAEASPLPMHGRQWPLSVTAPPRGVVAFKPNTVHLTRILVSSVGQASACRKLQSACRGFGTVPGARAQARCRLKPAPHYKVNSIAFKPERA